jgi:hypothetical protein
MANDPLFINYEPESNQVNSENRVVIVGCDFGRRSIGHQCKQVVNVDPVSSPFMKVLFFMGSLGGISDPSPAKEFSSISFHDLPHCCSIDILLHQWPSTQPFLK